MRPISIPAITLSCCLLGQIAGADAAERAVSALNGDIFGYYTDYDNDDGHAGGIGAALHFPLVRRLGANIRADYSRLDTNLGSPGYPITFYRIEPQVFWRNPSTAMLGVSHHIGREDTDALGDIDFNATTVFAEAYLGRLTLGGERQHGEADYKGTWGTSDTSIDYDSAALRLRVHPTENLVFFGNYGLMDAEDAYSVGVGAQPRWLGSRVAFSLSYARSVNSGGADDDHLVTADVQIFLGGTKSLQRRLREDIGYTVLY